MARTSKIPYIMPRPAVRGQSTVADQVFSTAWLIAEVKRRFDITEPTAMDMFRTAVMFMQQNAETAPLPEPDQEDIDEIDAAMDGLLDSEPLEHEEAV